MITDDNYVIPTVVAVQALVSNKKEETKYVINIIASGLSEKSKNMFLELCSDKVEVKIVEVDINKYADLGNDRGDYCQASKAALFKFDIPNLFTEYEKIIYLDGDLIVRKDLSGLYRTDIKNHYVAAVNDSGKIYSGRKIMKEIDTYFNSGVMLLNLTMMRKDNLTEKLMHQKSIMDDVSLMDQDVFNIVMQKKVKLLPIKYNYLYINLLRAESQKKVEICDINSLYSSNYLSLDDIRKDAVIIHFASANKPWKDSKVRLYSEWKKYFDISPAREKTDYLYEQQIKWLSSLNENSEKQFSRQRKRIAELEQENKYLKFSLSEIRASQTYKLAYAMATPVRCYRKAKNVSVEKNKYNKYRKPNKNGLNTEPREVPIIVSMTTYGPRMKTADIAIGAILRQTMKPDKIVVALSENDANNLSSYMKTLKNKGLVEILACEDLKSPHMKYYYTMKKYPDAIIITVDDDILYRKDLIESLYKSYEMHKDCVSALRVHRIRLGSDGKLMPYNSWKLRDSKYVGIPRHDLFATGVGGVLYPPKLLYKDIFELDVIKKYCLKADDIWLKVMELLSGTKVVLADIQQPLTYIDNTQEVGLFNTNVALNANDEQFKGLLDYYKDKNILELIYRNN